MSPLNDLNVTRSEVPPLLQAIRSPYEPIPAVTCSAIAKMVSDLDAVLGRDFDALPLPDKSFSDQVGAGRRGSDAWDGVIDDVRLHPLPVDCPRGYGGVGA